jgi:hypothetical protein
MVLDYQDYGHPFYNTENIILLGSCMREFLYILLLNVISHGDI